MAIQPRPIDSKFMATNLLHLGAYSDWFDAAKRQNGLYPAAPPGVETRRLIREMLGVARVDPVAADIRIEATWERAGLLGQELSWSVGYGPKTRAWLLKPARVERPTWSAGPSRARRNEVLRQREDSGR